MIKRTSLRGKEPGDKKKSSHNITLEFASCYKTLYKDFREQKYYEYTVKSGRGGGKSNQLADMAILEVLNGQGNVAYIRKYASSLRDSVYSECVKAIQRLGVEDLVTCSLSPLQIKAENGYSIYFRGLDDPQKLKSLKPNKGLFSMLIYEEMQEIAKYDFVAETNATIARGDKHCSIFYLFNPPPKRSHFTNEELSTPVPGYRGVYTTNYLMLPFKWLGEQFHRAAEELKKNNFTMYQYRYMGLPIGGDELIYDNITLESISDERIQGWLDRDVNIFSGMDFGWYPDPTAYVMMHYDDFERTLYIFKEWGGLKHKDTAVDIELERVNEDITDYLSTKYRNITKFKQVGYRITGDNDNKSISNLKELGWTIEPAKKGPGSRDRGFKWLQSLNRIVIDDERCLKTSEEFSEYHYMSNKDGDVVSLYPEGQADHFMAAVRYALEDTINSRSI